LVISIIGLDHDKSSQIFSQVFATVAALATPAFAAEVGVRVGPVDAGVTVGESHQNRGRDRDRTTVIKEHEPADRTTVIKKDDDDGTRTKTII
jgi:hypothetical protein